VPRSLHMFVLLFLGGACTSSLDAFLQEVDRAKECEEGDTCVVPRWRTSCTCPTSVNEARAARIEELTLSVTCNHDVGCAVLCNPRCEEGRCTEDYWCPCEPPEACPDAGVDASTPDGGSSTMDAAADSG
jgi:hypothetical protein